MKDNKPVSPIEAEQAMQQVLQAERDAEHAIHDCENAAQQIIHDAQVSGRKIHARANQRITDMEMRHGHMLDQMIKDIDKEGAVGLRHDAGYYGDKKKLRAIIEKLAVELCRGDSASDDDTEAGK